MAISNKGRGGVRKGAGRQPVQDRSKVKSKLIRFLVTEQELAQIRAAAGDAPVAEFIRTVLFRFISRRKKK